MPKLSREALLFLDKYKRTYPRFERAAVQARKFTALLLDDSFIPIHLVDSRPKSTDSLRGKLRRKKYRNPATQVTDLIALRVITYFWEDVDRVATELRSGLDVSERKSRDARAELRPNQFGYRSLHLIARLRPADAGQPAYSDLRRTWFEIQIRSILDHAWSEIEHEMIYKSGIQFPGTIKRRFTAVAGALEVLEHAFAGLAIERNTLIDLYKREYELGVADEFRFDVARLFAFLEIEFPDGQSWRDAEKEGVPFPKGLAVAALEALEVAKLNTAAKLRPIMKSASFRRAVQKFASLEGLAPRAVSHLALLSISLALVEPYILEVQFPEMLLAPSLASVLMPTKS